METWEHMLSNRSTTFAWSDKEVPKEMIQSMLDDLHAHAPSKQAMMPYTISILDWSNPVARNTIFQNTHRNKEDHVLNDLGNSQTLAPWLLAFSPRLPVEDDNIESYEGQSKSDFFLKMANLEIGIASSFMVWSAAARGLSTGYCACLNELPGSKDKIEQVLNPNTPADDLPMPGVSVLIGVGYKDKEAKKWLDPRTGTQKEFPDTNWKRPPPSVYVNWL
jgi:hypothetical protein